MTDVTFLFIFDVSVILGLELGIVISLIKLVAARFALLDELVVVLGRGVITVVQQIVVLQS